ncbi:MAG: DUF4139 domain-containing protein [Deltaproteobacteria bacterium]|nr:DUF4139 domain-containing protein [Deltaproteobacteria bacterium]
MRVQVSSFETPAEVNRVAFPDESADVFLRAQMKNPQTSPLLAGPVRLLMQGAEVGFADIPFVGSGERFSFGLAQDERLQVRCRRHPVIEQKRLKKDKVHFVRELEFCSASKESESFHVKLRLPKSEVDKLKVNPSMQHCTLGEPKLDDDGIFHFEVELKPRRRRVERFAFHFDAPSSVQVPDPW